VVEFSALTPTLDQVMAIWADVLRNPAFNEPDFKRASRRRPCRAAGNSSAIPASIGQRVMSKVLWGDNHPYGHLRHDRRNHVADPSDAAAFHKAWYGPNNATLFVVGDTTLAEITPKLEAALAGAGATRRTSADGRQRRAAVEARSSTSSIGRTRRNRSSWSARPSRRAIRLKTRASRPSTRCSAVTSPAGST
jgi:predicted Zn-dependent peptidase